MRVPALSFLLLLRLSAFAADPAAKAPPAERDFNPDAEHCNDHVHCDRRCYAGPTNCEGRHCSRDFVCRPAGYDPWHGKPAFPEVVEEIRKDEERRRTPPVVDKKPSRKSTRRTSLPGPRPPRGVDCKNARPGQCPPGCYSGPSVCVGMQCRPDAICAAPGYDPRRGR